MLWNLCNKTVAQSESFLTAESSCLTAWAVTWHNKLPLSLLSCSMEFLELSQWYFVGDSTDKCAGFDV